MRLAAPRTLAALILAAVAPAAARAQGPAANTAASSAPRVADRIPKSWKADEGLVVGQLAGTWDFGVATMGGDALDVGVAVKGGGGRPAGKGLFRGLVLLTRREGDVTLVGAYLSIGGMDQHLDIGRKFDARKGQITVLGLMYFQKQAGTRQGYRVISFDNREETMDYLRRSYPQLLAGHEDAQVVLAPGDYLPMAKLVELRTAIAQNEARHAKRAGQFWVAGSAGTIAEVRVAGDSVQVLRFLPPVTYHEPMLNSWDAQGTLTFSSRSREWRVVNGVVEEVPAK